MKIEAIKEQLIENEPVSPPVHWYLVAWKADGGTFGHADVGLDEAWGRGSWKKVVEMIAGAYPELQGKAIAIQSVMPIAPEEPSQQEVIEPPQPEHEDGSVTVYPWLVSVSFFEKDMRLWTPLSLLIHKYDDGLITKEDLDENLSEWLKDQIGDTLHQITFFGRMAPYLKCELPEIEHDKTVTMNHHDKSPIDWTMKPSASGQEISYNNLSSHVCRSDERLMEMVTCGKHPMTAMRIHPLMQTASYPPQPVMYCPECEPRVAEWEERDKRLRQNYTTNVAARAAD